MGWENTGYDVWILILESGCGNNMKQREDGCGFVNFSGRSIFRHCLNLVVFD